MDPNYFSVYFNFSLILYNSTKFSKILRARLSFPSLSFKQLQENSLICQAVQTLLIPPLLTHVKPRVFKHVTLGVTISRPWTCFCCFWHFCCFWIERKKKSLVFQSINNHAFPQTLLLSLLYSSQHDSMFYIIFYNTLVF